MSSNYTTIRAYGAYVRTRIFAPAGVSGPSMDHRSPDALAYTFPVNCSSWNSGDLSTMIGGVGWHMSADELLSVLGDFRRGGTIMSRRQAQTMLDSGFGIDVPHRRRSAPCTTRAGPARTSTDIGNRAWRTSFPRTGSWSSW